MIICKSSNDDAKLQYTVLSTIAAIQQSRAGQLQVQYECQAFIFVQCHMALFGTNHMALFSTSLLLGCK